VNFIQVLGKHKLSIRTYERGVEGETLACGTGSVAAALVAGSLRMVASPVQVTTRSKEKLTITFEGDAEEFGAIYLEGEAKVICEGTLFV
jgi:diaminopimelate epimerase